MQESGLGEFSITNKTRMPIPRFRFLDAKNDILGKSYSLSLAFVPESESQKINKTYRGKDYPTNVLSFSLKKNEGEIIICPAVLKKEVKEKKFDKNFTELLGFLVIHGMLHLKGMSHSSRIERERMERAEKKYDKKHFGGNRRGVVHDTSRSRRVSKRRKKS
ncbi:MAG: rRNA maturation RNase YbeY [Minisyncoccia bacterium]